MRLIDADALREKVLYHADTMNHAENHEQAKAFNYCLCMIDDMPTADVVEGKRGKWIPHEDEDGEHYGDKCSECGEWYVMPYGKTNYCPNCGAEMRGGD